MGDLKKKSELKSTKLSDELMPDFLVKFEKDTDPVLIERWITTQEEADTVERFRKYIVEFYKMQEEKRRENKE